MPADLPAPKSRSGGGSAADLADLPAPKPRTTALSDSPASKPVPSALADLPAPKAKPSALADLPAPKAKPAGVTDLPAPKRPSDVSDLPTPKRAGSLDLDDLPAPKAAAAAARGRGAPIDDELDLPTPKGGGGYTDLPMPKAGANNDHIAPKGFFDDLPQPAKKGGSNIDLPAPKGFFDDLPQPALTKPTVDLPAPKNFFDDLPQPTKPAPAPTPASGGGFFDDLPQPPKGAPKGVAAKPAAGGGLFDDIAPPGKADAFELELGAGGPLELDGGPSAGKNSLDVGLADGADFTELDLSEPSTKSGMAQAAAARAEQEAQSPIKIKTPKAGAGGKQTPIAIAVKKDAANEKFDLADNPHNGKGAVATDASGKPKPKRKGPSAEETAEGRAAKRKRQRVVLGSLLGLALLGSGGFYFYKKHTAEQARLDEISSNLAAARKALADSSPNHWAKASTAANAVIEMAPNNVPALGLAAEAAIAGALDNGIKFEGRIKAGRKLAQQAIGIGKTSPELERAKAVMAIAANQADRAIPMLQTLIGADPKSGWLQLYMGWAQLGKGDSAAALKAFEQAVALDPATKLPALYGHGQAKLAKADLDGAKSDFAAVVEAVHEHVGAQVGLAATLPPQQSAQREADLLAILNRTDLDKQDPRAVVMAWVLAGDVARLGARYDIARERYRKAIAITALDLGALTGLAAVELRDGKVQVARDLIQKALTANPNDAEAQLLDAMADTLEGKLSDAEAKLQRLAERQPPLPPLQLARMHVAKGRVLEAQGKDEEAIAEYAEGAKLARDLDLTPTMAAVTKLTELAKKAPDEATAMGYRERANDLLSVLAEKAKEDGQVALTLGVAYLQAGDAAKGEDFLRRAVTMNDKDPESRLQLAKALVALNRVDDAIASLKEALAIDPKRGDVALELARTYQNAGRDSEAMSAYEKLLADKDVAIIVRVNAGRYFAARGAFDKAAAQAEPILAVEKENQGGLYLKGEGLILAKKWDDARTTLTRATDLDTSDAQALDALGRAFDGSLAATDEGKFIEGARFAYERATKADPKMFHPHLGLGHALYLQGHFEEAIKPLGVASGLNKTDASVMYNMGLAYYGLRTKSPLYKKTAAGWFEDGLRNKPELPLPERAETYFRLGDLYFDLNKPADSARCFDTATKEGEHMEKDLGKAPDWLTETYYRLGQVYYGMNRGADQKRAYHNFLSRNPAPSERKNEAEQWMLRAGKNF